MARKRLPRDAYTVGWICALPLELAAAKLMIDELHKSLDSQPNSDDNIYTLGRIGRHNVVFLCLEHGVYGTTSAATAVANMKSTFANVKFGLMVGIGGGAPTMIDVRLGDVVVSKPVGTFGGVVQYDFGKTLANGLFERIGSLAKPPPILLKAISELDSDPLTTMKEVRESIEGALGKVGGTQQASRFQRPRQDWLFKSSYEHESDRSECSNCDQSQLVKRSERPKSEVMVHYGLIASGNQVIKDSETRDKLTRDLGVICFEMEAAGIMDQCPSLVIRGICDYCDSHKNKQWQGYAAVAAAAYAKKVLRVIPVAESHELHRQGTDFTEQEQKCLRSLSRTDASDHVNSLKRRKGNRVPSTCSWFLDTEEIALWLGQDSKMTGGTLEHNILWLHGNPGTGKSTMAITLVEELPEMPYFREGDNVLAYFFCDTATEDHRTAVSILGTLLKQLIWQRPRFMKHLMRHYTHRGDQLFTSFDALWTVLRDMTNDPCGTKIFCVIDALDECYGDSQRTLLWQIEDEFARRGADHIIPKNLHILITSRPYPEISQYLSSFYNNNLASYPTVATDLRKVIREKVQKLARQKNYTSEVITQVEGILEEKAEGTFLWVGISCSELEDIPSWKAVTTLQKLPRGLHALYTNLLQTALQVNKDDEALITRMLEFLVIAREPPTVAGISKACQLFVNESETNRLQFTREVIGFCRLMIVIDGDLVRLLHKSVKDFLIKDTKRIDELEANAALAYRCIDYFLSIIGEDKTPTSMRLKYRFFSSTRNDWFLRYSAKYWPEHASLAEDRFTVDQRHRKLFFFESESWELWCHYYNFLNIWNRLHDGFSSLHAAARWGISALVASAIQSDDESPSDVEEKFIDDEFKTPDGVTPLGEAAEWGQIAMVALMLRKSPRDQVIRPNVLQRAVGNPNKGVELTNMLLKYRIQVTKEVISAAAGNEISGKELIVLLLDKVQKNIDIRAQTVIAAANNHALGREVMETLLTRSHQLRFTNQAVVTVCRCFDKGIISNLLKQQVNRINTSLETPFNDYQVFRSSLLNSLMAAAASNVHHGAEAMELLLHLGVDWAVVSEYVTAEAADNYGKGLEVLRMPLARKNCHIRITEGLLKAAAGNIRTARQVMEILLDQVGDQAPITDDVLRTIIESPFERDAVLQLLIDRHQVLPPITPDTAAELIRECGHEVAISILHLQGRHSPLHSRSATQVCKDSRAEVTRLLLYEDRDAHLMMNISTAASGILEENGEIMFRKKGDRVCLIPLEVEINFEAESKEKTTSVHGRQIYLPISRQQLAVLVSWIGPEIIELLFARAEDHESLSKSLLCIAQSSLAMRQSLNILVNQKTQLVLEVLISINTGELFASAAKIGSPVLMTLILSLRGNESINMQDSMGCTPLFHIAARGHYEVAKMLLSAGANPSHTDQRGWHAWVQASRSGHKALCSLLFQAYCKSRQDLQPVHPDGRPPQESSQSTSN
ncbi:hypothetical protein BJX64DRAFT_271188 [Aspergillus heterothallicus]